MNYIEVHGAKKGRFTSSMAHYTVYSTPLDKNFEEGIKENICL